MKPAFRTIAGPPSHPTQRGANHAAEQATTSIPRIAVAVCASSTRPTRSRPAPTATSSRANAADASPYVVSYVVLLPSPPTSATERMPRQSPAAPTTAPAIASARDVLTTTRFSHRRRRSRLWSARVLSAKIAVPATMPRTSLLRHRGHSANLGGSADANSTAHRDARRTYPRRRGVDHARGGRRRRPGRQVRREPGRLATAGHRRIPRQARGGGCGALRPSRRCALARVAACRRRLLAGEVGAGDPDPPGGDERDPSGADKRRPTRSVPLARVRAAGGHDVASAPGTVPHHLADTRRRGGGEPSLGAAAGGSRADLAHGPRARARGALPAVRLPEAAAGSGGLRRRQDPGRLVQNNPRRPAGTRGPPGRPRRAAGRHRRLQRLRQRRRDRPAVRRRLPTLRLHSRRRGALSQVRRGRRLEAGLEAAERRAAEGARRGGRGAHGSRGRSGRGARGSKGVLRSRRDRRGGSPVGAVRVSRPDRATPQLLEARPGDRAAPGRDRAAHQPAARRRFSPAPGLRPSPCSHRASTSRMRSFTHRCPETAAIDMRSPPRSCGLRVRARPRSNGTRV